MIQITKQMERKKVHLVFVPITPLGHIVSMVELAKLILNLPASDHQFTITIIIMTPSTPNPQITSLMSTTKHPNLSFLEIEPIEPPASNNGSPLPFTLQMLELYKPSVKEAIQTLISSSSATPITALVFDFICSNMIEIGNELGVPPYVFFTSSATLLGLLLHHPKAIDPLIPSNMKPVDMKGQTVPFPGFSSQLPFTAFPDVFAHGKGSGYEAVIDIIAPLRRAVGFLVNTFNELQPGVIKAMEEGLYVHDGKPPPAVYTIGPILSMKQEAGHECVAWLDAQPRGSVVFLCFGSRGTFAEAQVKEIAVGLERSGWRFLWVVRAPPEKRISGVPLKDAVLDDVLPEGFVERTRGRGLVWPMFAPQGEILGHEAVGGFVTHCGWNSCLESLWFGVPMATWPLYTEQHLNAFEMVEEMGVAVEVRVDRTRGNWADAEEVERAVRLLMGEGGGAKVRERVRELKEKGRRAVEVGGSSHRALMTLADTWLDRFI